MTENKLIAAVIMAKDEARYIHVTIESVKNEVDGIILFDTGSKDNTVSVVRDLAQGAKLSFHLLEGDFEDFAKSRNRLLKFADTLNYDFLLLLDCNDELRVTQSLKTYLKSLDPGIDAFLVQQQWFIGSETLQYFNNRLIRPNKGFLYEGVVHEYLNTNGRKTATADKDVMTIYQNRTIDDKKSCKRWENDLILLEKELARDVTNSRTQYYLAQTYDCLNMKPQATDMYSIRAENCLGFQEERFIAMMKIAELSSDYGDKIKWYFKAYLHDHRAEPLVELSKLFREKKELNLAFNMAKTACDLEYPTKRMFLVNKKCYDHDRWQEMSISAYYVGKLEEGKASCLKAIESGFNRELNENNLKFYLETA